MFFVGRVAKAIAWLCTNIFTNIFENGKNFKKMFYEAPKHTWGPLRPEGSGAFPPAPTGMSSFGRKRGAYTFCWSTCFHHEHSECIKLTNWKRCFWLSLRRIASFSTHVQRSHLGCLYTQCPSASTQQPPFTVFGYVHCDIGFSMISFYRRQYQIYSAWLCLFCHI